MKTRIYKEAKKPVTKNASKKSTKERRMPQNGPNPSESNIPKTKKKVVAPSTGAYDDLAKALFYSIGQQATLLALLENMTVELASVKRDLESEKRRTMPSSTLILGVKRGLWEDFDAIGLSNGFFVFQYTLERPKPGDSTCSFFICQMKDNLVTHDVMKMLNLILDCKRKRLELNDGITNFLRTECSRDLVMQLVSHELVPPSTLRLQWFDVETAPISTDVLDLLPSF